MARPRRGAGGGYIGPETLIEADFSKGMISDADGASLAPGQVVSCSNFMLDKVIPYKRGGSEYIGDAFLTPVTLSRIAFAEFPAPGQQEIVVMGGESPTSTQYLYWKPADGSGVWITASGSIGGNVGYLPAQKPVIVPDPDHIDGEGVGTRGVLVWGVAAGNDLPRVYAGEGTAPRALNYQTGITNYTGGRYVVYYKSRLALASSTTYDSRMWFSPAGVLKDVESLTVDTDTGLPVAWDPLSYIDFDFGITGTAALQNSMLVFSRNHVERLTGDAPPPGGNMSHGPILAAAGCSSARSIANYKDAAIWASPQGVYMSSGVGANDLTSEGGILRAWQEALEGWDDASSTISGEVVRNFYVVATQVAGGDHRMWICDIPRRVWWQVEPAAYSWLVANPQLPGHLYATRDDERIYNLTSYFEPSSTVRTDADGAAITASLTTRMVNGGAVGLKNWRDVRALYELTSATSAPTMDVAVLGESNGDDYGTTTLPEGTLHDRQSFVVAATDQGVQLTVDQATSSDSCRLFGFEIDFRPIPLTRGGSA